MKLSVVIPVYNEAKTVADLLNVVKLADVGSLEKELIVVDDGSTDGTRDVLKNLSSEDFKVYLQPINQGKGAAIRRGFAETSGDFIIIQDADLEYNPREYKYLLQPLIDGMADVVYRRPSASGIVFLAFCR